MEHIDENLQKGWDMETNINEITIYTPFKSIFDLEFEFTDVL